MEAIEKVSLLKELDSKTFYKMEDYSQLVIDIVYDIEDDFEDMTNEEKEAEIYYIKNILNIIDSKRNKDIEALHSLIQILE